MKVGDGDGMTVWLMSGSCLHECVLVGGGNMQIYSDFEQAFNGSKGHLETLLFDLLPVGDPSGFSLTAHSDSCISQQRKAKSSCNIYC